MGTVGFWPCTLALVINSVFYTPHCVSHLDSLSGDHKDQNTKKKPEWHPLNLSVLRFYLTLSDLLSPFVGLRCLSFLLWLFLASPLISFRSVSFLLRLPWIILHSQPHSPCPSPLFSFALSCLDSSPPFSSLFFPFLPLPSLPPHWVAVSNLLRWIFSVNISLYFTQTDTPSPQQGSNKTVSRM